MAQESLSKAMGDWPRETAERTYSQMIEALVRHDFMLGTEDDIINLGGTWPMPRQVVVDSIALLENLLGGGDAG